MARRPNQRRLFQELAAKFGPEVAKAFIEAINDLTSAVEFQKLTVAIERRDLPAAMEALHLDRAAFAGLEAKINEAYVAGGTGAAASMPKSVSVGFRFDPGNQRAAEWIRRNAGNLITGLIESEIAQARAHLSAGMASGASPRKVGLDLVGRISRVTGQREGGLIGLAGPQRTALEAARAELASSDPAGLRSYLTRGRRDRRFDRAVMQAIKTGQAIPADTAATMANRYSARLLQLRGEVIARTEGLPAIRAAKREAYQQLVDAGRVDAQLIVRTWITTRDGRERETHGAMSGQKVRGLDAPFRSPGGAMLRYPGDSSLGAPASEIVSCRCDETIAVVPRGEP